MSAFGRAIRQRERLFTTASDRHAGDARTTSSLFNLALASRETFDLRELRLGLDFQVSVPGSWCPSPLCES
eukprot:scaffold41925_cov183-Skeletonema_dohrnii-CCMP3373.AAC.1